MNRPQEKDYASHVAYTRALESYCDAHQGWLAAVNEYTNRVRAATAPAPEQSRSQKLRDAGYTPRPLALPPEDEPDQSEPVLEVIAEPDHWHNGHFYEDTGKSYISESAISKLPIGTKLYTAPPPQVHPLRELSDEDIQQVYLKVHADGFSGRNLETAFARSVLAAQRSKTA